MALLKCLACSTRYAVGLDGCPQCGSTKQIEEGAEMAPKITRHGGPSIAGVTGPAPGEEPDGQPVDEPRRDTDRTEQPAETNPPGPEPEHESDGGTEQTGIEDQVDGETQDGTEGGEQPSAGSNSSPSTERQQTSSAPSKDSDRKPARTTGSRSGRDRGANSTARSTGGSGTA